MIIILDRRDAMTRDLSTIELILEWAKEAMQPTERAMTQCFLRVGTQSTFFSPQKCSRLRRETTKITETFLYVLNRINSFQNSYTFQHLTVYNYFKNVL